MGVGAGPDAPRVVVVAPAARDVTVLGLAPPDLRAVVAVVPDARLWAVVAGAVGAVVVEELSAVAAVELVVVLGGPAIANCPPFRKDGGPLWVIL